MTDPLPALQLEIHPATPDRWGDLVDLFERPGPRGGKQVTTTCWCMYWRMDSRRFAEGWGGGGDRRGAGNRAALQAIVEEGRVPGILAYLDGQAVGWCSVAPRGEFLRLERARALPRLDHQPVWSVVCFYVHYRHKGRGVGQALLEAAVRHAAAQGARIVEGYASRPGDADPFTGLESMFAAAGFTRVRPGGRRSTWRYVVASSPTDGAGP